MLNVVFFGTPDIALPVLNSIFQNHHLLAVVTMPDKPRERGGANTMTPVKKRALELGVKVFEPNNPKEQAFIDEMRDLNPDIFVVFAYGHILRKEVLDIPKLGPINIHTSLLPLYRGAAPIERAILAGEKITGISIMKMDVGMDTGPVYLEVKVTISDEMDSIELKEKLSLVAVDAINVVLNRIENGLIEPKAQNHLLATLAPKIQKEELYLKEGLKEEMSLKVRGLTSYGGVKILLSSGEILKIFKARPVNHVNSKMLEIHGGELFLKAINGSLSLIEVQLEGKKRMGCKEFLNGYSSKIN
ncbi:MAG: methionyl-tRNA formyltransferase [Verrucomicrobia bacterium]|nr:methionyl-tRNA formyltransferase [Verrucomicrobiota bacterium]